MIRIDLHGELMNGYEATFQAPCDCSEISSLIAYYPSEGEVKSKTFTFRDTHGNNLGDLGDLFVKDAFIKVILDKENGYAYIQNADTNGYLEHQLKTREATLSASGWTSTAPYAQTVTVPGITANDRPMILMGTPTTQNASSYNALKKAFAMIDRVVSEKDTLTVYCYSKKPTVAIPIIVKGA